jgi:hypothetical protein
MHRIKYYYLIIKINLYSLVNLIHLYNFKLIFTIQIQKSQQKKEF